MFDTFKQTEVTDQRKQLQCNDCKRKTIHTLEACCVGDWSEEHPVGGHISGGTSFSLYRCGACDAVCFEKGAWHSEDVDHDDDGRMYVITHYEQFPPPSSADFSFDTAHVPHALSELIDEMMYALAGGKFNLATIGLRLVIEFIVNDKKAAGRSLLAKIDDLKLNDHIDEDQRLLLHKIRVKGNKGAHEGISMNKTEMVAGMSIVALLLEKLYNGPARHADAIQKAQRAFKDE